MGKPTLGLCQIGRNNARQHDAIESTGAPNADDADLTHSDIPQMKEIGANQRADYANDKGHWRRGIFVFSASRAALPSKNCGESER